MSKEILSLHPIRSRSRLARLSQKIAEHPIPELDAHRFPRQNKPDNANPICRDSRQKIQNELRVSVGIERPLHQNQDKKHWNAKQHGIKVSFPKEFSDWNPKLAAHVAWQKEQSRAQQRDGSAQRVPD